MKRSNYSLKVQTVCVGLALAGSLLLIGVQPAYATGNKAPGNDTGIVAPSDLNIPGFSMGGNSGGQAQPNPQPQQPQQQRNNQAQIDEQKRKEAAKAEEARKKAAEQEKQRKAAEAQQKKRDEAKMAAQKKADEVSKLSQINESKTVSSEPPVSADVSGAATTADSSGIGMNPNGTIGFDKNSPADIQNISWMSGTPGYWFTSPVFPIVALLVPIILILAGVAALLMRTRFGNEVLEVSSMAAQEVQEPTQAQQSFYPEEKVDQMQTQIYEEPAVQEGPLDSTAYDFETFDNINPGDTFIDRMRFKLNNDK